jgi:hypothetical protein
MAHKGYTLNYFIDYFQSIPAHQWCTGTDQKAGTVQHCAQGHALRDTRTTLDKTESYKNERLGALEGFIGDVTGINDGAGYKKLGKTPRGRVLTALRNRKRHGNIYGNGKKPY